MDIILLPSTAVATILYNLATQLWLTARWMMLSNESLGLINAWRKNEEPRLWNTTMNILFLTVFSPLLHGSYLLWLLMLDEEEYKRVRWVAYEIWRRQSEKCKRVTLYSYWVTSGWGDDGHSMHRWVAIYFIETQCIQFILQGKSFKTSSYTVVNMEKISLPALSCRGFLRRNAEHTYHELDNVGNMASGEPRVFFRGRRTLYCNFGTNLSTNKKIFWVRMNE